MVAPGKSLIAPSFSHAGDLIRPCRRLSQVKLAALVPTMRRPLDCPRERVLPLIELELDGELLYRAELAPSGGRPAMPRSRGAALIDWKSKYALGIPAIDHEHRELIGLINETHAQLGQPDAHVTIGDFPGEIYAKISAHFALEEKIMRQRQYDEFAAHKADHERLLDEISRLLDAWHAGEVLDEAAFATTLSDGFSDHFRSKDARLHRFLH